MNSSELRKTVLHDIHRELRARMVDFAGWDMPVQYADHHSRETGESPCGAEAVLQEGTNFVAAREDRTGGLLHISAGNQGSPRPGRWNDWKPDNGGRRMYPEENLYTKDHEWLLVQEEIAIVGITDFAQHELGDVVYVDLPEIGDTFEANEPFGSVESVKAVSEIFCPVSGEIVEVNKKLEESPELVNQSPHQNAWMIKIRITHHDELGELLSASEYEEYLQEQATN